MLWTVLLFRGAEGKSLGQWYCYMDMSELLSFSTTKQIFLQLFKACYFLLISVSFEVTSHTNNSFIKTSTPQKLLTPHHKREEQIIDIPLNKCKNHIKGILQVKHSLYIQNKTRKINLNRTPRQIHCFLPLPFLVVCVSICSFPVTSDVSAAQ